MKGSFQLAGFADAIRRLRNAAEAEDAMKKGVEQGAGRIATGARARCRSSEVRAGITQNGGEIASTSDRAWIEEYGSGPREGERGPHNYPARPYMRPAMDEDGAGAVDDVAASLKERFS